MTTPSYRLIPDGENRDTPDPAGDGSLSGRIGDGMDSANTEPLEPCWPFWGQLKSGQTFTHEKINFERPGNDYFDRFYSIGLHALRILGHRDITEITCAAEEIGKQIDEEIDAYIENETEAYVQKLYHHGGWELGYFSRHEEAGHITLDEIRDLLKNWPTDFDGQPSLPSRDDLSELDALGNFLENDKDPDKGFIQLGFCEAEPHEFYAVLALMTICQAIHSNPRPQRVNHYSVEPSNSALAAIGDATIQAVEIMAYADKIKLETQIKKAMAAQWSGLLATAVNERAIERASKAAIKRHAKDPKQADKALVRECWDDWQKQPDRYNGKAAFARDMRDKFPNLKSQPVIEGWCRAWGNET